MATLQLVMKNSVFCIFVLSLYVHNYGVMAKHYGRFDEKSEHPTDPQNVKQKLSLGTTKTTSM